MSEIEDLRNPAEHTCVDCGYTWKHGQHGGHSCVERLQARIAELEKPLPVAEDGKHGFANIAEYARAVYGAQELGIPDERLKHLPEPFRGPRGTGFFPDVVGNIRIEGGLLSSSGLTVPAEDLEAYATRSRYPWAGVALVTFNHPQHLSQGAIDRIRQTVERAIRPHTSAPVVVCEEGATIQLHGPSEDGKPPRVVSIPMGEAQDDGLMVSPDVRRALWTLLLDELDRDGEGAGPVDLQAERDARRLKMWLQTINRACADGAKRIALASLLNDQDKANQVLRAAGYGWSGLGILETAQEIAADRATPLLTPEERAYIEGARKRWALFGATADEAERLARILDRIAPRAEEPA